ncbi:glycine receptor subunit alpha-2-like [Liolophura sinensis]|uniref:glycine receptor subunit alpha-2-like n=1 Tax=Liolophura sinensis TaxID=3198878 RepID=UPI00315828A6
MKEFRIKRWGYQDEPTVVECQLFIYSFDSFSETTMDFSVNMFLRQQWTDYRLHFHDLIPTSIIQLDSRFLDNIWVPDLYFVNGKNGKLHDITMPNRLIHVYKNATVLYNIRVSMTFSCPMDLTYYPLDIQICFIEMASCKLTYLFDC